MKKGLIMELKDDYAIVMNDDGSMEKIVIKPQMAVGQKIFYFDEDIAKVTEIKSSTNSKFKYNSFMKTFGSMAAMILLAFTFFFNMNYSKTVAVVSLDINPSIQIEVDNNQNILKVTGINDDGRNIDFSGIEGKNINDGIKAIKDILVEKEFLKENKDVLVGFAFVKNGEKADYEDEIKEAVLNNFDTENVTYIKAEDKTDVKEAEQQGISLGRYEAAKTVVDEETKKKIANVPVKEITEKIKDKENVNYYNAEENKTSDVNASKENKPEYVPAEKPSGNVSDDKTGNNNSGSSKEQGNSNNVKPGINASGDEKVSQPSQKDEVKPDNKSEINNGMLELEPEKPSGNDGKNDSGTTIIDPDKNTIENNPTSGKIEEDKVQEIEPEPVPEQSPSEDVSTEKN